MCIRDSAEDDRNAFIAYMDQVRAVGTDVNIITFPPDRIYLSMVVFVDTTIFKVSGDWATDGESVNSTDRPVEVAIANYFRRTLGFANAFYTSNLIDAVQAVEGVVAAEIDMETKVYYGTGSYNPGALYGGEEKIGFPGHFLPSGENTHAGGILQAGYAIWQPVDRSSEANSKNYRAGSLIQYIKAE